MKILSGMFCSGAGERFHFNISPFLLLCTEHGGMALKGGPPMGSISSFIPQGRGSLDPTEEQPAGGHVGLPAPFPTLVFQPSRAASCSLGFQPKWVGGAWQVLASQAHSRLTDSRVFERNGDELLQVDQTNYFQWP